MITNENTINEAKKDRHKFLEELKEGKGVDFMK